MSGNRSNGHDLAWRLRQLPRERSPAVDAWPAIAARLTAPEPVRRHRHHWVGLIALAASVLVAVIVARPWDVAAPVEAMAGADPTVQAFERAMQRQAGALAREYESAIAQFEGAPLPAPVAEAVDELDRSARAILAALEQDPEAHFLIDRLRSTYARRLTLTQRALVG